VAPSRACRFESCPLRPPSLAEGELKADATPKHTPEGAKAGAAASRPRGVADARQFPKLQGSARPRAGEYGEVVQAPRAPALVRIENGESRIHGPVAQPVDAPGSEPGFWRFESSQAHFDSVQACRETLRVEGEVILPGP
jgi:hypothetical protein